MGGWSVETQRRRRRGGELLKFLIDKMLFINRSFNIHIKMHIIKMMKI